MQIIVHQENSFIVKNVHWSFLHQPNFGNVSSVQLQKILLLLNLSTKI